MFHTFKSKLLAQISPDRKIVYEVRDVHGMRGLTKLHVRFGSLNDHRFRHNINCLCPICLCNIGIEVNGRFFLHCPLYDQMHIDLFGHLPEITGLVLENLAPRPYLNYSSLAMSLLTILLIC